MGAQSHELKFFLLKRRLPSSESASILGRVVKHFLSPTSDYTPQSPEGALTPGVWSQFLLEQQVDHDAHITASASKDDSFWAKVRGVLAAKANAAEDGSSEITSPRVLVRALKRESTYLEALKKAPHVRREMLRLCPVGGKVYLVVGTMSFATARVRRTGNRATGAGASATVPVAGGVDAGGASIELGAERSSSAAWTTDYTVQVGDAVGGGQEVFAIACREISRNLLGMGADVKLRIAQPEYRGGVHFGVDDSGDSDDSDNSEDGDASGDEDDAQPLPPVTGQWDVDSIVFTFR